MNIVLSVDLDCLLEMVVMIGFLMVLSVLDILF